MKNLMITMTLSLLATIAHATTNLGPFQKNIQTVNALEKAGQVKEALLVSCQTSQEIAAAIGLDQTVASITSSLDEIRQEVITEKHSVGGSFSFLGLISGHASRTYDVTRILTVNPQEVAGFGAKVESDYRRLQSNLVSYVRANELGLIYTKAFAAKALQLAAKLSFEERQESMDLVLQTAQKAQRMTFNGVQIVEHCVTTNHINKNDHSEAGIGGLFLSAQVSANHDQMAYTSKECSRSDKAAQITDRSVLSAKLSEADSLIEKSNKALGLKELEQAEAPAYPTWGSPAFR